MNPVGLHFRVRLAFFTLEGDAGLAAEVSHKIGPVFTRARSEMAKKSDAESLEVDIIVQIGLKLDWREQVHG